MTRLFRGIFIVWVVLRYGLDELVLTSFQRPWLKLIARIVSIGRTLDDPRGQRIREALERLGPIFVKFGQVLSTRRDPERHVQPLADLCRGSRVVAQDPAGPSSGTRGRHCQ